jgi:hypothetical protein
MAPVMSFSILTGLTLDYDGAPLREGARAHAGRSLPDVARL